jgi:hypothetical protein
MLRLTALVVALVACAGCIGIVSTSPSRPGGDRQLQIAPRR